MTQLPITIKNPNKMLNDIADGYGSLTRTLMEYIDNSFDSADEFYDNMTSSYTRNVIIDIEIDRNKNIISILDNCVGMDSNTLQRLATEVNNSQKYKKPGQSWVNGQFGLGAHAFRLFAKELTVISKMKNTIQHNIFIDKQSSYADFDINIQNNFSIKENGTMVIIGNIDKKELKKLTITKLKEDIERHFEMLLKRNVSITIKEGTAKFLCKPYDYNKLEGQQIEISINSWISKNTITEVSNKNAIEIKLKVCKETTGRPVCFVSKGRKIADITDVTSFKNFMNTYYQQYTKIWSNPLLTGYIDLKDNLEPVINRNDYKYQKDRNGIYDEICNNSDYIYSILKQEIDNKSNQGFKNLGTKLTDILSRLAEEDSMKLNKLTESSTIHNELKYTAFDESSSGNSVFEVPGGFNQGNEPIENPGGKTKQVNGTENKDGTQIGKSNKPKKNGIQIEFYTVGGESKRAHYGDGIIYIYTEHPDFQSRISKKRGNNELSSLKITARLANYLAAIISAVYKEQFYHQKNIQPNRDRVLEEQIDFIFRFEHIMQEYINSDLNTFGEIS